MVLDARCFVPLIFLSCVDALMDILVSLHAERSPSDACLIVVPLSSRVVMEVSILYCFSLIYRQCFIFLIKLIVTNVQKIKVLFIYCV